MASSYGIHNFGEVEIVPTPSNPKGHDLNSSHYSFIEINAVDLEYTELALAKA